MTHTPVLLREVLQMVSPAGARVLVDCTVGLGGHAAALLEAAGEQARLIGLDVDEHNLRRAKENLARFGSRVRLFQANFEFLREVLVEAQASSVDIILADLGVGSTQLDDAARGLSFMASGPLDMRLDPRLTRTAADVVRELPERELADVIFAYGEERYSRRIARAIAAARATRRIETTTQLAELVSSAVPAMARKARSGVHPATRTFQALRIAVNDELGALERSLAQWPGVLACGARAAVISFHSLEDRRVKQAFAGWARDGRAELLCKRPLTALADEIESNPRSRSAKLRGLKWIA